MEVEKIIRAYLSGVVHMSLATSADDKPWICEVHYVYDDSLNFYFLSKPSRRHSQEIEQNPNVAGNIIKQHGPKDKPQGVYFEGTAELMDPSNKNELTYELYDKRFGLSEGMRKEIRTDPAGHKFYMINPVKFVLFDTVNFPDNSRQEWKPT